MGATRPAGHFPAHDATVRRMPANMISRTEDRHDRDAQRRSDMHGARVIADQEPGMVDEGRQFADGGGGHHR